MPKRAVNYPIDDQKRSTSCPGGAVLGGADYLVIGRPITEPPNATPRKAAETILAEMQSAFDDRG
jgi:orotidine-5'-phosphate decarboxylase